MNKQALMDNIAMYPWESETQKQGYLTFIKYMTDNKLHMTDAVLPAVAWMIQKDHEANEYWTEAIGNQVTMLQDEIMRSRVLIEGYTNKINSLAAKMEDTESSCWQQLQDIRDEFRRYIKKQLKKGKKNGRPRRATGINKLRGRPRKGLTGSSERTKLSKKSSRVRKSTS